MLVCGSIFSHKLGPWYLMLCFISSQIYKAICSKDGATTGAFKSSNICADIPVSRHGLWDSVQ